MNAVMHKTRHRGRKLVEWFFVLAAAATFLKSFRSGMNLFEGAVNRKTAQFGSPLRDIRREWDHIGQL